MQWLSITHPGTGNSTAAGHPPHRSRNLTNQKQHNCLYTPPQVHNLPIKANPNQPHFSHLPTPHQPYTKSPTMAYRYPITKADLTCSSSNWKRHIRFPSCWYQSSFSKKWHSDGHVFIGYTGLHYNVVRKMDKQCFPKIHQKTNKGI